MKLDFTGLTIKAQWHTYKIDNMQCELEIEPYPQEEMNFIITPESNILISGKEQKKVFMRSLKRARYLTDADDNPLQLTEEIKEKIFAFQMSGIPAFVISKSFDFNRKKEEAEKN